MADVELDPVVLAHEADTAWAMVTDREAQITRLQSEQTVLRRRLEYMHCALNGFMSLKRAIDSRKISHAEKNDNDFIEYLSDVASHAKVDMERVNSRGTHQVGGM